MTIEESKVVLGIRSVRGMELTDLKKVYRKLAKERHPDNFEGTIAGVGKYSFKETNDAYEYLTDNWDEAHTLEALEEKRFQRQRRSSSQTPTRESVLNSFDSFVATHPWLNKEIKDYVSEEAWDIINEEARKRAMTATQEDIDRMCMEAVINKRQKYQYESSLKQINSITYAPNQLKNWGEGQEGWTPFGHNFTNDKLLLTVNAWVTRKGECIQRFNLSDVAVPLCTVSKINVVGALELGDVITISVEDMIKVDLTLSMLELSAETKIGLGPVTKVLNFFLKTVKNLDRIEVTL